MRTQIWLNVCWPAPHYGERWGQHWLDVVRFAETDGFEYDTHRKDAWRYRDYVINAFNDDKPYDRFILEQLAGDEIGPTQDETLVAAGFNRLGPLRKNAGNQEVASSRNEVLTEMTNVVGSSLLGVTLGCARCHDHMFDPIRQSDYYRMQAFFCARTRRTCRSDRRRAGGLEGKGGAGRAGNETIARSHEGACKANSARRCEKKIKEAQERMPSRFRRYSASSNDAEKQSPIHVLARGEYQKKGERVGMRPLGVLLAGRDPGAAGSTNNPRPVWPNGSSTPNIR